jgi:Ca-activated chloride channel family protein
MNLLPSSAPPSRARQAPAAGAISLLAVAGLALTALACGLTLPQSGGPPYNAAVVDVVANTSLKAWLDASVPAFNASGAKTAGGQTAYVQIRYVEAGQAVTDLLGGASPDLWIPDDPVWTAALADKGNANYQADCLSVARSPLVIAMWRPLAESLGWPGRALGWLDIGSLAADPTAWAYYSGGRYGPTLRLGHAHPGLSGAGAATLLAVVQAAQFKTEAVTADEIKQPIVTASLGSFESAVSWFSKSTDALGAALQTRGLSYLGAAVVYESTVLQYGGGDPGLVPIYPFEGTFMASHPACTDAAGDATRREAALLFRAYLTGTEAQTAAVVAGLRPVNPAVKAAAPLDAAHGVDLAQPRVLFGAPGVASLYAIQGIWGAARKPVNLVMLLDTSGSMSGDKLASVRSAATQFVKQMGESDSLTLIAFSSSPNILIDHARIKTDRDAIISAIQALSAGGSTALYDAIGQGAGAIARTSSPGSTNAMVLLTDGLDTNSSQYQFNQALFDLAAANNTTVFTIAFGADADKDLLSRLAAQANGNFYPGDQASIGAIYDEMSAAFGGSAGVGR